MDEKLLQLAWMRSVLRPMSVTNPSFWPDEDVVASFAALPEDKPITAYKRWLEKMGISEQVKQQQEQEQNEQALNLLRATAPNVTVENK